MDCKRVPLRPFPLLKLSNLSQFIESEACFDCPNHNSTLSPNFGTQNLSKLINDNLLQISSVQSSSNSVSDQLNESNTITSEMLLELSAAIGNGGLLQYPGFDSGNCALPEDLEEQNTMTSEMLYDLNSAIAEGSLSDLSAFSRDSVLDLTSFCRDSLPPVCPIPERLFPETLNTQRKRSSMSASTPLGNAKQPRFEYDMPLDYRLFEDRYRTDVELDNSIPQQFRVIVNRRFDHNELQVRIDEIIEVDDQAFSDCTSLYPTEPHIWLPKSPDSPSRRNSISIDNEYSLNENDVFSAENESSDIGKLQPNCNKFEYLEHMTDTIDLSKASQIIGDHDSTTPSLENPGFPPLHVPSNCIYVLKNIDDIQTAIHKKLQSLQPNERELDKPDDSDLSSVESVLSLPDPSEMSVDLCPTGSGLDVPLGPEVSDPSQLSGETLLVPNADKTLVEKVGESVSPKGIDFCFKSQLSKGKSTGSTDRLINIPITEYPEYETACENVVLKTTGIVSLSEIAHENNEVVPLERRSVIFQHISKCKELPAREDIETINILENPEAGNATLGGTSDNDYNCVGASIDGFEEMSAVGSVAEEIVTLSSEEQPIKDNNPTTHHTSADTDSCIEIPMKNIIEEANAAKQRHVVTQSPEKLPTNYIENYNNSTTNHTLTDSDSCIEISTKNVIEERNASEEIVFQSSEKHPTDFIKYNNNSTTNHTWTDTDTCMDISTKEIIEETNVTDSMTGEIVTFISEKHQIKKNNSTTNHTSAETDSCIEISTESIMEVINPAEETVTQSSEKHATKFIENKNNITTHHPSTDTDSCIEMSMTDIIKETHAADSMAEQIVTLCDNNPTTIDTQEDGDCCVEAPTKDFLQETSVAGSMRKQKLCSSSERNPPEFLGKSVTRTPQLEKKKEKPLKDVYKNISELRSSEVGSSRIEKHPSPSSENHDNLRPRVEKTKKTVSECGFQKISTANPIEVGPSNVENRLTLGRREESFISMGRTTKKDSERALSIDDVLNDIRKENELRKLNDKMLISPAKQNDQNEGRVLSPEISSIYVNVNQLEIIPDTCPGPFTQIFDVLTAYQLFSYETLNILYDDFKRHPETEFEERLYGMPLSSFVTSLNNLCDLPQKNSFISSTDKVPELSFFIWKVLSVQKSVDRIKECQKVIQYFSQYCKENVFLDKRNLIVILINMGITSCCCPFPELFDEVSKSISSKWRASKPCREEIFKDEVAVMNNKQILLRNLGYLIGTLSSSLSLMSLSAKQLSDVFVIIAWLSLDLDIFKCNKEALTDCITAAIAHIPESDWRIKVELLSSSLLSMSSDHSFALHFVKLLPSTERGRRLRRCFSYCMLQRVFVQKYYFSRKVSLGNIATLLENSDLKTTEDYKYLHNIILLLECCVGDTFKRKHKNCLERIVNYLHALYSYIKESEFIPVRHMTFLLYMKLKGMLDTLPMKKKIVFEVM